MQNKNRKWICFVTLEHFVSWNFTVYFTAQCTGPFSVLNYSAALSNYVKNHMDYQKFNSTKIYPADLRFPTRWLQRLLFSSTWHHAVRYKCTNVSNDRDNRDSKLHDITYHKTPTLKVKSVITFFFASISVQDEIWHVTQCS